ncbi:MAG: Asp-tRNA(Asn)/Glu-tRNA(Gln) amidotransferase subunit GatC [bacterium]|nr:Asp-tRNA(Asn)/Glu-tRNA(Gln) amidotransferase subunit GatC [bacterium]
MDKSIVEYLANLARIKLSEKEIIKLAGELETILDYISQLNQLDTEKVKPANNVLTFSNVWRKDEVKPSLSVQEIMKNAPEKTGNMFKVPGII